MQCVLKKDDIFIDWSLWSVAGPIVLSILWFECGLSSNQISTNDVRNIVLFVVDPSSIYHYIFWSNQYYHRVHMMVEVQWYGNSDELLLSPSVAFCLPPWIMLNINLVLKTCVSISSCFVHEAYVWMKVVTSSNSRASDASCRRGFEKVNVASFGIIPKSVMHTCEVFCGSETCNLHSIWVPSTPSHWLICSRLISSKC